MLIAMVATALFLLILGTPLYLVFLTSSLVALIGFTNVPLTMIAQTVFDSLNSTVLLAVPYFILSGEIMSRSKMTDSLIDFFDTLIGRVPGSDGVVTVVSSAFFGAISGSAPAAVATIGKITYPAMLKKKYSESFASALVTTAGSLAIIIPPSITMILYSSATGVSTGRLFIAGVIPGLLLAGLLSAYVIFYASRHGLPRREQFSWAAVGHAAKIGLPTLLMPIAVLGGIYAGIFTPTEAGVISVVYAAIASFLTNRNFRVKDLLGAVASTTKLTAQILVIMAAAGVFSQLLTLGQIPFKISTFIQEAHVSKFVLLLMVNVIFLIAGMFIDSASAIVALIPLMSPVMMASGVDMVHFGLIIVLNLAIGMFTPPFGLDLFTTQALFKIKIKSIVKGIMPFLVIYLIVLLLVTYIPGLALWLPNLMY